MRTRSVIASLAILGFLSSMPRTQAQTPEWIWHSSTNFAPGSQQTVYFRKTFRTPPLLWLSRLTVSADDAAEVFLNGVPVATCERWDQPVRTEVTVRLNQGENALGVRARNNSGPSGLLVHLHLGGVTNVVSDASWLTSTNEEPNWNTLKFNAAHWSNAQSLGAHGILPWGDVLSRSAATSAESLTLLPGFKAELLRSAQSNEGSWICMAFDDKGRLIISPEGDQRPLLRFTMSNGGITKIEPVPAPIHYAMGLLYANESLYANARGPDGAGLYRLTDQNANDQFDTNEVRLLKKFEGGSEHGYHALRLGPDGKIYVVNGNGTKLPNGLATTSPHRNYAHDVLSLNPDETTEAGRESAVQSYILRTDLDGSQWELWAGGMRNAYAFDFSPDGELFAFDSDMEWDWGTPWYRPIRILHGVSGGDYGWRDGTRTWPEYYEDSLPSVLEVGIGSPTGVRFGTKSNFPEKYRRALFAMDWSYGRILAVHLQPAGASYRAASETFLKGTPLNLTDLAFGPDGALYFITGGRATQSGLYRVTFQGELRDAAPAAQLSEAETAAAQARDLRRQLERRHGHADPAAIDFLWPHLDSTDRVMRYAARIALESQDLAKWKDRALAEPRANAGLNAGLALVRVGPPESRSAVLSSLARFPLDGLTDQQRLLKLRIIEIGLLRQGQQDRALPAPIFAELDRRFPANSWPLNRELSRILIYLGAPGIVPRTLDLLASAPTQAEQFHYVAQLRNLRQGWTPPDRRRFFEWWIKPREQLPHPSDLEQWFADVGRKYVDGAWVDRYLREFRNDAVATLTKEERQSLGSLINMPFHKAYLVPSTNRVFVREWTMADLLPDLERVSHGRSFARGRQVFVDAQCIACHRFGNDGGSVGPELTSAASKYDTRSLLESILEPSKVIAEPYQNLTVYLKNGDSFTGRIVRESADQLVVETDPLSGARESVPRPDIDRVVPSKLSPMPEGLANILTRDEILDLLAYLASAGRPEALAHGSP